MFLKIFKLLFGRKSLKEKEKISNAYCKRWEIEKKILEQQQRIKEEKYELKHRFQKKKYPFSKLLLIFLFVNFTILELFTGWVTIQSFTLAYTKEVMPDLTPLITLIGAIVGQTISYGVYAAKSKAENTAGGITYDLAMQDFNYTPNEDGHGVG